MKRRSQTIQRSLPRPHEVNNSILRPANTPELSLTELQKAEELIKQEMLTMMHYDSIRNPIPTAVDKGGPSRKAVESSHNFLANHPYNEYNDSDMKQVRFHFLIRFFFYQKLLILLSDSITTEKITF